MSTPVPRRAARVLLLDEDGCVLLVNCLDPAGDSPGTWWNTPGGGVDPGESAQQAGARELAEETGLVVAAEDLGPVVHERVSEFWFGGVHVRSEEEYLLLRLPRFEPVPTSFSPLEVASVIGWRWWSLDDLRGTSQTCYPAELPGLLVSLAG